MIPYKCIEKHSPQHGYYGDCLRACVASVLEIEPHLVPHFFQDGCDGLEAEKRVAAYLKTQGLGDFRVYYPGEVDLSDILTGLKEASSDGVHYLLYCSVNGGGHVVVGCGDAIVHDPAWYISRNYQPTALGVWIVSVFVKL